MKITIEQASKQMGVKASTLREEIHERKRTRGREKMNERPNELPSIALRRKRREQKKAEMKECIILFFSLLSWAILAWIASWVAWLS